MTAKRRNLIKRLLKGIETGEDGSVEVINPNQYIQHNPHTHEGRAGLLALFKRLSETNPKVDIVRAFSDGDYVFAHTRYDFSQVRVGFEVFRFEGDMTVEHWDNIQTLAGPNRAGQTMLGGETQTDDLHLTEQNRQFVSDFIHTVLINQQTENIAQYIDESFIEHNASGDNGLNALKNRLTEDFRNNNTQLSYQILHRTLADGNFVLTVCEGYKHETHTAFYDLFRVSNNKICEHWDTVESVAPASEWQNQNGKF